MSRRKRVVYGFGHFYNDICAGMWFTYLLVYFQKVLRFTPFAAGMVFLLGQVADAVSTPLIGIQSDKANESSCCQWYGRRKIWHLIGTICVTISFPFLFNRCLGCWYNWTGMTNEYVQIIYYVPFVVTFQFGWAAVQVAHLAMIPELTPSNNERTALSGIRYAFTVLASLLAFLLVWLFLRHSVLNEDITPQDSQRFSNAAYISVGIGVLFSTLFHIFIPDKSLSCNEPFAKSSAPGTNYSTAIEKQEAQPVTEMGWRTWFKEPQFYYVGAIYMCVRLFNTVFMAYLPLYILDTQRLPKEFIALVPMTVYLASFVLSLIFSSQRVANVCRRKPGLAMGLFAGMLTCIWASITDLGYQIFGLATALGVSSALLIVNALALMTDMIGKNTESGAFLFGAMSFFDKVSSGVVVQMIQYFAAGMNTVESTASFYRLVITCCPGVSLLLSLICLLILWPKKLGIRQSEDIN